MLMTGLTARFFVDGDVEDGFCFCVMMTTTMDLTMRLTVRGFDSRLASLQQNKSHFCETNLFSNQKQVSRDEPDFIKFFSVQKKMVAIVVVTIVAVIVAKEPCRQTHHKRF